jgi:hypothetical protein
VTAQIRQVLDGLYNSGGSIWCALATTVLVDALIQRGGKADLGLGFEGQMQWAEAMD